jgi:hypothetical protein
MKLIDKMKRLKKTTLIAMKIMNRFFKVIIIKLINQIIKCYLKGKNQIKPKMILPLLFIKFKIFLKDKYKRELLIKK